MGEEEARTEVSDVVANGTTSPERVKEDVIDHTEEKNGVRAMEEGSKDEGKVDAKQELDAGKIDEAKEGLDSGKMDEGKEELDAEKMDEDKEEVKKEKEPKEKEQEEKEEQKSEAIEEGKGTGKGEQEEDNKGGKADESKEKIDNVEEESKEDIEDVKEKGGKAAKKRKRGNAPLQKSADKTKKTEEKEQELKTPIAADRPVRERKSVERLVAVIEKHTSREFHIEKGRGTSLKDIPNVAYKLSRRKGEDTFKLLHTILFGRRGKAAQIKTNISRFSGFVWRDNEEKEKTKAKEKLDKCVKEKLVEICEVLDIPVAKATTKKEDIVAKLINFLMAPHATTTELLSEKEQSSKGKKRGSEGSASRPGGTSSRRPVKSRKKSNDSKREVKKSTSDTEDDSEEEEEKKGEEAENGLSEGSEDENAEHSESKEENDASEEESEEDTEKTKQRSKKKSSRKDSAGKEKTKQITSPKKSTSQARGTPKRSSSKLPKVSGDADDSPKVFSRKKKSDGGVKEKASGSKKPSSKEKPGKKAVKGKEKSKNDKTKPADDELRNAICEILKEVDFNTATFTDILKQLAKRFDTDLTPRKAVIKLMIQDELTKLADEADDEEEGGDVDAEKEEAKPAEQGVEA